MTTTVYDSTSRLIAADTRWSADLNVSNGTVFVYVDEDSFTKVADLPHASMVLAGNGLLISEWKRWWYTSLDENNMPPMLINGINAVAILIIDKINNRILFDAGQFSVGFCVESQKILSVFSGSGRNHAFGCWELNGCPFRSIQTASKHDICTSENVIYVDFKNGSSNIPIHSYDFNIVVDAIINRGFVMDKNSAIPIAQHSLSQEIRDAFRTGSAVASAPVPGLSSFVWTDQRKEKLKSAIQEVKKLQSLNK